MNRHRGTAAAIIAISGLIAMSDAPAAQDKPIERTVSVSASGQVAAEPDAAHISTGVVTEADTARDALTRNSTAMRALIDGLRALGLSDKDVQTSEISVEPRYHQHKDGRPPTITGYRVVNQMRIIQRNIGRLGEVLDTCVSLGANQLGGIRFEVSGAETLKDEARRRAMANAVRRAQLYAKAAGASVGQVLTISETVSGPRPAPMGRMAMAEAVPIEAGSQMLEVTVHVTWALR